MLPWMMLQKHKAQKKEGGYGVVAYQLFTLYYYLKHKH